MPSQRIASRPKPYIGAKVRKSHSLLQGCAKPSIQLDAGDAIPSAARRGRGDQRHGQGRLPKCRSREQRTDPMPWMTAHTEDWTSARRLALQCCRIVLRATLAGIKCRDLGEKQWGLRVPPGFNFQDEVSLQQVRSCLAGETFPLIILDANCCLPVPQASLLGPRKMASYWALLTRLVGPTASERLQMFLRAHNFNARSCLSALTRDHVTGPCS